MLSGRNLSNSDAANAPLVSLIDARFAERFFPGQNPIGQEIAMYGGWARRAGVTGAIRGTALQEGSRPVACYSLPQVPFFSHAAIVARSDAPAAGVIREAVRRTDTSVPIFNYASTGERIGESLGVRRDRHPWRHCPVGSRADPGDRNPRGAGRPPRADPLEFSAPRIAVRNPRPDRRIRGGRQCR